MAVKNKITDLRNILFETLERLMDPEDDTMTIEKAQTIGDVAQVIVNSAKVEADLIKTLVNPENRRAPETSNFLQIASNGNGDGTK